MLNELLIVAAGIVAMLVLAELAVRNGIELAACYGLSGSFIGLTVLSIGTSVPEIMSHVVGSAEILLHPEQMHPISGLLIGTNIGSDIFQQNFILPLVSLLGVVVVVRQRLHDVMGGLLGAALLAWLFCLGGMVSRLEGAMLMLAYMGYLVWLMKRDRKLARLPAQRKDGSHRAAGLSTLIILVSFAIMAVVTNEVVLASTQLVELLPISASFFGVVLLGISTSLPELTTALLSMYKGKRDISAGILLGSNVTNPLLGLGLGATISSYTVPDVIVLYDLPVNIVTAILLYIFLMRSENLSKAEALTLLSMFFAYLYLRVTLFPGDIHNLAG